MSQSKRPQPGQDFNAYYSIYTDKVGDGDIYELLKASGKRTRKWLKGLPEDKWDHRYAEGKWSIKEILIHLCDAERVFAYRLLCTSRNDKTSLPGFEHNDYVPHYHPEKRSVKSLLKEYKSVRSATLSLLSYLDDEAMARQGTASGWPVTPLGLAYIIAGHELHHMKVVKEKYLTD